ncbi:hypothetical protein BJF92_08420 [Rhizobium rhizosphaerae]|uniref:Flippase-like domain-containing protein n=1 Tax=Xaviernesmea rhizosphaerae TaxID=1672749 RepID=A0A1Q9AK73_9HYPH|nr:lysylphosphatidylglycerol synthase transmembrane domain-containing protein [Xaviernesmea rhizosphaerae]OLP55682.1 hypothetical protein BJF92_08420 [Xaviernesmea rhizosphaerae]
MFILRILAPLVLLALVLWFLKTADLAPLERALSQVSPLPVIAGLILVQIQIVASALRWRFTAARLGQAIAPGRAIGEYYVASLLNQSLPGGMAGDAIRAYRMRRAGGWQASAKAVLFERLSGQIAFFTLALGGVFAWPSLLAGRAPGAPSELVSVEVLGLGALALVLVIAAGLMLAARCFARAASLVAEIRQVFLDRGAWAVQAGLSVTIVLTYVVTFFIASQAVGAQLGWQGALTVIPLSLLAMLIPAGLGGWGTREAAAMALWPLSGANPQQGLAASLVYGLLSLAGALPGLAVLLADALQRRSAA